MPDLRQSTLPASQNMSPSHETGRTESPSATLSWRTVLTSGPVAVLGLMMFLLPALGVTNEYMLQDTFKSALAAFSVLAAALVFFWQQRQRTAPLLWHGLVLLPLALMAYALISMAWSHAYLAAVEAVRWFVLSLLLWLGLNTLTRPNLPTLLWGIHAGAVVASIWTALQFWYGFGLFPQGPNPASSFINRNFFAEYAVCVLPFSIYLLATLHDSRVLKWMAFSVAFNVVAIMMTGTRSALIALLVLAPVFLVIVMRYRQQFTFQNWHRSRKILVMLVLALGVLGLGSVPCNNAKILAENTGTTALQRSFSRAASMTEGEEYTERSFSIRAVMWKATARMMLANPLAGVGAGAWEVQIPLYQRAGLSIETDFYAHNEFLQLLSEYGVLLGGLFLAVLFAYLILAAYKTWHLQGSALSEAPLLTLTLASLLAMMVVSSAGFPWHLASTGTLFAQCLAILAASDARLGAEEAFFAAPLHWCPRYSHAALVCLVGSTVLAAFITRQATEVERKIVGAVKLAFYSTRSAASNPELSARQKTQLLQDMRESIAINPHYRKLTPMVADTLAANGDWANAAWIWESVAASRPHVAVIWLQIARAYTHLAENDRAMVALQRAKNLNSNIPGLLALELVLLSRTGHAAQAEKILLESFDQNHFDADLPLVAYAIGLETHNFALAIRSLELRNQHWPEFATDTYLRLGKIYADPAIGNKEKALAAFRAGLQTVPPAQKDNFLKQVPENYRAAL